MNVIYNSYILNKPITGVGRYLQSLSNINGKYKKIALTPNSKICWENNFSFIFTKKSNNIVYKLIWNYFHPLFYNINYSIYHSPFPSLPFFLPRKSKKIITIHDLIFLNRPNDYPFLELLFIKFSLKNAVKRADLIICVSEYTKNCLIQKFPKLINKTEVVLNSTYNKIENNLLISDGQLEHLVNKKIKYFVLPSNRHPRKNIKNTIHAFINSKYFKNNYKLVLCGLDESSEKIINDNIIDFSYLNDNDYQHLLKNSHGLFYFSYEEGFGYPITEAMNLNIPIFCSNIPSTKEIFDNDDKYLCSDLTKIGIQIFLDKFYDGYLDINDLILLMQSKKNKFNFEIFEDKMKKLYSNLLQ
jgi:glycosyltransferase involved in cell wall biosynthesis